MRMLRFLAPFLVGLLAPPIIVFAIITRAPATPNQEQVKTINDLLEENNRLIRESECFTRGIK
jgi:hypothetical protein